MKKFFHIKLNRKGKSAYSLAELLVVMLIIGLLGGLGAVAFRNLSLVPSGKAAVSSVVNILELARAEAILQNKKVYVVFSDSSHPDPLKRFNRFAVFKEPDVGGTTFSTEEMLTNWKSLPDGQFFIGKSNSSSNQDTVLGKGLNVTVPAEGNTVTMPALAFNERGIVSSPNGQEELWVVVANGFNESNTIYSSGGTKDGDFLERRVRIYPLTGRVQALD